MPAAEGAVLNGLAANADLRGHRIDVSWAWTGIGTRPAFRLLRRRRAFAVGPEDGYPALDSRDLFRAPDQPWAHVSRVRYLADGSDAEGGLLQAELALFHDAPGAADPTAVEVSVYDPVTERMVHERVDEVSRVERMLPAPGPWGLVEAVEIFHTPGGDPETSAGVVTVFRDHSDGTTASRFFWAPAGGAAAEIELDRGELLQTTSDVKTLTEIRVEVVWSRVLRMDGWDLGTALADPADADPAALAGDAVLDLHEDFSEDTGDWTRSFRLSDLRVGTEVASYYTLFTAKPSQPDAWRTERKWRARSVATARYGFSARLYGLLPSVHQYYDEPKAETRGQGQLRRFLEPFGVALDHLRSGAEALGTRHDLAEVRGDFLPALGEWIGWRTDRAAPLPIQRSEIRMAPAAYETVGTLPNLVTLARRVTGWECRAKEFVHSLFLTNAPEAVRVRELWEMPHDGAEFGAPIRLASTERFDGRPAPIVDADGRTRLFWHSNRSGRWELWHRVLDGGPASDPAPLDPLPEDTLPPVYSDLSPAAILVPSGGADELWLFWESDRDGPWDVWARVHDGAAWGEPMRITSHAAADRRPSAALGAGGTLWLFWESERRGSSEIWSRTWDGTRWSPAVRVTEGFGRDREPTAALDADDRLRLVWRRDEAGRSQLWTAVHEAGAWGAASPLESGPWRDESPALVRRGAELWLLWHSDRTGRWELWGRVHDGAVWGEPFQITMKADPDKEPGVIVDGASLRIFWRSERPSMEHRSRTVDTRDTVLLERLGRFADRLHYTYDTAREELDWYARDVVGLYVTPPPGAPEVEVEEVLARARTYLEPFVPATVRLVLISDPPAESADS